jgi:hypothetical membrane protein
MSAGAAPIALLATAVVARSLATADYNPVRQTLSVLAAAGRSEWVMTFGIGFSAACLVVTGLGLVMVRPVARFVLAAGGLFGIGVALFPVSEATTAHLATTCISAFLLAVWPVLAMTRERHAPFIMRAPAALSASIALFVLLGWTVYETQGGTLLGIAERVSVLAEMIWPAIVVVAVRFSRSAMPVSVATIAAGSAREVGGQSLSVPALRQQPGALLERKLRHIRSISIESLRLQPKRSAAAGADFGHRGAAERFGDLSESSGSVSVRVPTSGR